jgi:hypothetical protein
LSILSWGGFCRNLSKRNPVWLRKYFHPRPQDNGPGQGIQTSSNTASAPAPGSTAAQTAKTGHAAAILKQIQIEPDCLFDRFLAFYVINMAAFFVQSLFRN